jgi:lauroyl/myristoyl acyltransferase
VRTYILFRLAGMVAPLLPRRLGYALMGLCARLMYRLGARNRDMIQSNVRHVLGPQASAAEIDAVARRIFHNLLKNYFDLFWLPAQRTERIAPLAKMYGEEHLVEAQAYNRGIIALSVHLGNQEIMTQFRAITDHKLNVVAEHVTNERVFKYLVSLRQSPGINIIPVDTGVREVFRALKRSETVGLVFDRDINESGRVIPFFGSPARLPDGYAVLALRLGAPILPGVVLRTPDGGYALYLDKPMLFEGQANNDDDIRRVMTAVAPVMERFVSRYLDQWVYFHYVWEDDKERVRSIEQKATAG